MTLTTRLLMVRHGAVADPWPQRIYGRLDVPLSAVGEAEARRVAEAFQTETLAAVVSSGLARAEFTAGLLREPRGLVRRDDPRLLELDRGSWAGRERAEVAAAEPERWARSLALGGALGPEDGEAMEAMMERVRAGLDGAAALGPGGQVAVVAHLWVLRSAAALVLGLPAASVARLKVPTGGVLAIDWAPGGAGARLVGLGVDALPTLHP